MRVPVVDSLGVPLMPCQPGKARRLMAEGKARPKWGKLGIFYIQLAYEQKPDNQPLAVGVDPGSKFEGYSVVGSQDTVLNLMAEAPTHVKDIVEVRRNMRRARRYRNCRRRPRRSKNRLLGQKRIPPSTRSRWEAKARIVGQLKRILPLADVAVEDVKAVTRKGRGGKWNLSFSSVQVGKEHLYRLLEDMGLKVWKYEGWQTAEARQRFGLKKCKAKSRQSFESHAVDAWTLAASVTGATKPTCKQLWYSTAIRLNRRQLHMLQFSKGGVRRPQGGTRSLGFKRGTLVRHPKHGMASVGGFDRRRQTLSLHDYRSNKRLTQGAKVVDCKVLAWTPYRTYLVPCGGLKPLKRGASPTAKAGGLSRLEKGE